MTIKYPDKNDYVQRIAGGSHDKIINDQEIKSCVIDKNKMGLPKISSGTFGVVFKFIHKSTQKEHSLKCFTVYHDQKKIRLQKIADFIKRNKRPYFVDFDFIDKGILIQGTYYPILKMDWITGNPLLKYMQKYVNNKQELARLRDDLLYVFRDLRKIGVGHGDFQEGNILVLNNGEIRLIDYDGMYIPEFKGKKSMETGNSHYQHCQRNDDFFHEDLDSFSEILIYLGISILIDNSKWEKYGLQDYLLFKKNDLKDPDNSDLFKSLLSYYSQTSTLGKYIRNFKNICLGNINDVPTVDDFILHKYVPKKQNVKKFIIYEDELGSMKTVDGFAIVIGKNAKIGDRYEIKAFGGIARYEISDIKRRSIPKGNSTDYTKSQQSNQKKQQKSSVQQQQTQARVGSGTQQKKINYGWLVLLLIPIVLSIMMRQNDVFDGIGLPVSNNIGNTTTNQCGTQCLVNGVCVDIPKNGRCSAYDRGLACYANYELTYLSDGTPRCKCKSEDFTGNCSQKTILDYQQKYGLDEATKYASENCICNP